MRNYDAYNRSKIYEANINFLKKLIFETSSNWNKNTSMRVGVSKLSFVLVFPVFLGQFDNKVIEHAL